MKKHFALALALIGAVSMFTSCSDEKDGPIVPGSELEAKTYSAGTDLTLNIDGTATLGQDVEFTPATDGTATLTLKGQALDISSLIPDMTAVSKAEAALAFPTSCVIPGSAEASIKVTLAGDADKSTFTGNGDTEYCTFAYAGEVTKDAMTLNLSDIKLKNTSMAGTYTTHAFENNAFNELRAYWVSNKGIELYPGFSMDMNAIINMTLAIPMIEFGETTVPVAAMLPEVLKSVTLGEDGSVTAKYADTAVEGMPVKESAKGLARYVVKDDKTLLLFLDPQAIIATTMKAASKSRSIDLNALLEGLVTNVVPMLANGVPVVHGARIEKLDLNEDGTYTPIYDTDENAVSFYLGTETLLPILKTVSPIFTDDEIINTIVEAASQDPNMGSMASMLPGILKSLPAIIDGTSQIELGINLYK